MNARLLLIAPQFLMLWRRLLVASALVSVFGIAASAEEFDCHQEITLPACSHIDKMIGVQCSGDTIHGSARQHNMVQYAFDLSCGGSFKLSVLYASTEAGQYSVYVNNEGLEGTKHPSPATGGTTSNDQIWGPSLQIELVAGRNTLRFDNTLGWFYVALPSISKIRLQTAEAQPEAYIKPFQECTSGVCAGNYACVDNGGDNKFFCKPRCRNDADCVNPSYPGLRCLPHKRWNNAPPPSMVCNNKPSFVYQPKCSDTALCAVRN
jgi:hypothetical protein